MIKVSNLIKFYVILLLNKPKHGYELIKELEQKLERKISASQIYPFLNLLEKEKFVSEIQKITKGRKIKNYKLTKKGRNLLLLLTGRIEIMLDSIIRSKIAKCINCGCSIYGEAYTIKIKSQKFKFCCEHCAKNYLKNKKHTK